jgi:transaldolase
MSSTSSHSKSETRDWIEHQSDPARRIAEFVHEGIDLESPPEQPREEPRWKRLNQCETALWLDSGDMEAIDSLWNDQFSGLTTNNNLLNKEVQNGTYDDLIPQALPLVETLSEQAQVQEIAFILNVRHALRLVERFRCNVSVELHTDVAHDTEATLAYARRCHEICPEHFVVKVPLTPAGLIAITQLRREGIRVNCTLGFSARQNYVATAISSPSFVNVFLGRLNSYVADNGLGDGALVGEKATIESQHEVSTFTRGLPTTNTRQIAASLRDPEQLPHLAGVDVITMPTSVAEEALDRLKTPWLSQLNEDFPVTLHESVNPESIRLEKLWSVNKSERNFVQKAILNPPQTADDLVAAARENEVIDLFPEMSESELQAIAEDGKIPKHERWGGRIAAGDLAVDSLMTLAGLAYFAESQRALDQRIREQLGR